MVLTRPLPAQLVDGNGRAVGVTGDGLATAVPARLSVAGGPWVEIVGWAGPWPSDERWWSARGRRRQARMQVVTTRARATSSPGSKGASAKGLEGLTYD